jgi:hypothetical protein
MPISYSGDRPQESGELRYGGQLPPWQLPARPQCVIRHGQLICICGECEPPPVKTIPMEELPENTPGWTTQKARLQPEE